MAGHRLENADAFSADHFSCGPGRVAASVPESAREPGERAVGEYPEHVAAAWMGHSKRIAFSHYQQVTDEQFRRAVEPSELPPPPPPECPAPNPGPRKDPNLSKNGYTRF